MPITTIFFGSSEYSLIVLKKLTESKNFKVLSVVTSPHKNPVSDWANKKNIPTLQPEKVNNANVYVVAYYGKFMPKSILKIPDHGVINIHPSKLPKYRGTTPIQSALVNGDKTTAVTLMLIDSKMDHGDIIAQKNLSISESDTFDTLLTKASELGADLLLQTIPDFVCGKVSPTPQNHKKATFTKKLTKEDGKLDWTLPATQLERIIRAYSPWPGTWTTLGKLQTKYNVPQTKKNLLVKINKAHLEDHKLVLDRLQVEGKKEISWEEFRRGYLKETREYKYRNKA